jgi:hypothetical protein
MAERIREETYGAVRDIEVLFRKQLRLGSAVTEQMEGRTAMKYAVSLKPEGETMASTTQLPAVAESKGGRDESTKRRLAFFENRQPQSLSGHVWVDTETGVILRSQLNGTMSVPSGEKTQPMLKIALRSTLTPLAKEPLLRAPPDALPDADKPEGIADALDRFGIPRAGKRDAGTAGEEVKKGTQPEEE